PILERFRRDKPEKKILLTFFSPSGYDIRKNYDKVDCVAYLPFDTPRLVSQFLDAARPKMAIFAKYEFWGNYLQQLHQNGIPTYIISSIFRPQQRFFRPWGGMFRKMLQCYTHLYVQDNASRKLLSDIGVNNVTVAGDTRFDRVTDIMATAHDVAEIEAFVKSSPFTLIVGSSWQPDEAIYIPWLKSHPDVKAIIAPHEFDQERLNSLRRQLGEDKTRLLSEIKDRKVDSLDSINYLIIDCFGLLSSIYRYADAAIIGGGFGAGIHNLNEAAVYGIPVLFGPNHKKFKEAGELLARGGGFTFANDAEFNSQMDALFSDADARHKAGVAAGQYIKDSIGASDIIYSDLFKSHHNSPETK
ncbi:MAG: 3-deoxy-D-manno-octulosonic acid transferase, partial [Muribaculaceae bacterium]|nr:3-deoxy-D-manno-octulosonic acid transferase [Muribaculaceae bacterium]